LQGARNSFINCSLDVVRGKTSHFHVRVFLDGKLGKFCGDFSVVFRESDGGGFAKPIVPLTLAEFVFVHEEGRVRGFAFRVNAGCECGGQRAPYTVEEHFRPSLGCDVADEALQMGDLIVLDLDGLDEEGPSSLVYVSFGGTRPRLVAARVCVLLGEL